MPRVLRIINRLNLGGPTYNAAYLTKHLAPEFETMLVAGIKQESEESSEFIVTDMGLSPVYIPEMHREINFKNDRASYLKIKQLIKDFRPDIVHTHAAKAGTLGRLAASSLNVPVIIHTFHGHVFHSYFNPVKTFVFKQIEKFLSNRSTRIIAISEIQKHELCNIHRVCSAGQTEVIQLGFDLKRFNSDNDALRKIFRQKYQITDDTLVVAIIGRLVAIKNHILFLDSYKLAKDQFKGKMKGVIIGDGELRNELENRCREIGLSWSTPEAPKHDADIIFTSWIKNIEEPLAGCDIVAMTSLNEGTPVSLIEAQAAGKPIVTTDVGGISNVVIPGETALLSESSDADTFSKNLLMLLNNKELRDSMATKGWQFVSERFQYDRLVEDMRKLYRSLLS